MPRRFLKIFNSAPIRSYEFIMVLLCILVAKPTLKSCILGAMISLSGLALKIWASGYRHQKNQLNTGGPYSLVRHPKSLGTFILILGLCVAGYNYYFTIFFLLSSSILYWIKIGQEEQHLATAIGPEYFEYCAQVPRFFPKIAFHSYHSETKKPFSLRYAFLIRRNRKLEGIFVLVIAFATLFGLIHFEYHRILQSLIVGLAAIFVITSFVIHRRRKPL